MMRTKLRLLREASGQELPALDKARINPAGRTKVSLRL